MGRGGGGRVMAVAEEHRRHGERLGLLLHLVVLRHYPRLENE